MLLILCAVVVSRFFKILNMLYVWLIDTAGLLELAQKGEADYFKLFPSPALKITATKINR